jgi:CRP-like cAMP-binding protein
MDQTIVKTEKHRNGDVLFEEGTWAFSAYIVKSGNVKILKQADGKQVIVATMKEGDVFGEMAFLAGTKRSASAVADGDVEVGVIWQDMFMEALNELPSDVRSKLHGMVSDLTALTEVYAKLSSAIHEVKGIQARIGDLQAIEKRLDKSPDYLRRVVGALVVRLRKAAEGCSRLTNEIEAVNKSVEALSAPTKS